LKRTGLADGGAIESDDDAADVDGDGEEPVT
jgi:hypothetical protein